MHRLLTSGSLAIALLTTACAPATIERSKPLPMVDFSARQPAAPPTGSIYNSSNSRFLFSDQRARRTGDLITVILNEETVANKSASTSSARDTSITIPAPVVLGSTPTIGGNPTLTDIDSGTVFSGSGDSSQSNSLRGSITVVVTSVMNNGNLVVSGKKLLTLNQGKELVSISGIVRPSDLSGNNTINSNQIADAQIVYNGNGLIANSNRAGWLTKLFNSPIWPF